MAQHTCVCWARVCEYSKWRKTGKALWVLVPFDLRWNRDIALGEAAWRASVRLVNELNRQDSPYRYELLNVCDVAPPLPLGAQWKDWDTR